MMQINSYLTFNGNCREAMQFYQQCLGGELTLQTVGESPMAARLPPLMKNSILHATLINKAMVLMGSDMVNDNGFIKGNTVSLLLNCSSEVEIKTIYQLLATGGKATHPPEHSFWGTLFGDLEDKYGNQWLLHFSNK